MIFPFYLTLLRLSVPLLILFLPLPGILLSIFLDGADWNLIPFTTDQQYFAYQFWDKALDLYYLSLILLITLKWKDTFARSLVVYLFIFRVTGFFIFFLTQNRQILFYFPNLFENFVLFFLLSQLFLRSARIFTTPLFSIVIILILSIPKLIHEYFIHFLSKQPWELFPFTQIEFLDQLIWFNLLYLFPISFCLYLVQQKRNRKV